VRCGQKLYLADCPEFPSYLDYLRKRACVVFVSACRILSTHQLVNLSLFLAVSYPQSLSRAVTTFARVLPTLHPRSIQILPRHINSFFFFSQTAHFTVVNATVFLKFISFWERRQFFDNGKQKIENSPTATKCG